MKCKEAKKFIIEDSIEPLESFLKMSLEEHLEGCEKCRHEKALLIEIENTYRERERVQITTTPELDAKILGAVHKLMEEDKKKRLRKMN